MTKLRCPDCNQDTLEREGDECPGCRANDEWDARQDARAQRRYVDRQLGMLDAILGVAREVCDREEIELLTLTSWSDERVAERYSTDVAMIKARREAVHEKIRAAIEADPQLASRGKRRQ